MQILGPHPKSAGGETGQAALKPVFKKSFWSFLHTLKFEKHWAGGAEGERTRVPCVTRRSAMELAGLGLPRAVPSLPPLWGQFPQFVLAAPHSNICLCLSLPLEDTFAMCYRINHNDIIMHNYRQFPYSCACVVYKCHITPPLQSRPQALISERDGQLQVRGGWRGLGRAWVTVLMGHLWTRSPLEASRNPFTPFFV